MSIGRDEQPESETSGDWFAQGLADYQNNFTAVVEDVLDKVNEQREKDGDEGEWSIYDPDMTPDFLLSCPCGSTIEQDGRCPNGHESPLGKAGLV